ncbi:hypothetical protein [Leptospira sanjuanensis]|uniref:hypothetical protein n=1 Tax=Leptospira sanjuanensis TaxID=2879643 RepID=UPI001EE8CB74|nr:hypothetical protein [Leptospira sanjuanensis]MCG6170263.1 hypothetical protein [Leptospira sanjuanensis]
MDNLKLIPSKSVGFRNSEMVKVAMLLHKYKWKELGTDHRIYEHRILSNLLIHIKSENEIIFKIKGHSFQMVANSNTIEELLNDLDSNWKQISLFVNKNQYLDPLAIQGTTA